MAGRLTRDTYNYFSYGLTNSWLVSAAVSTQPRVSRDTMQQQARRIGAAGRSSKGERDRSSHSLAMGTCTCGEAVTRRVSPEPRVSHIMQAEYARELVEREQQQQDKRSLFLATRGEGKGGALLTRRVFFNTYCIRWPIHNKSVFRHHELHCTVISDILTCLRAVVSG